MAKPIRSGYSSEGFGSHNSNSVSARPTPKPPSPASYFTQGVVHSAIGLAIVAAALGFLTIPSFVIVPHWVLICAAIGSACNAIVCFVCARGIHYSAPPLRICSVGQLASLAVLFYWFTFGDSHLPEGARVAIGAVIGFMLFILTISFVMMILFPNAIKQMEQANLEREARARISGDFANFED